MAARKSKKPNLTRERSLDSRVVGNPEAVVRKNSDGTIALRLPLQRRGWFKRLAGKAGDEIIWREFELDEIGAFVWGMCDGQSTVRQMRARLSEKYKLARREAELSLTNFISTLGKKGLVAILVPEDGEK